MRDNIKKLRAYIFRGWDKERGYTHPLIKILPPFLWEIIPYLFALTFLFSDC